MPSKVKPIPISVKDYLGYNPETGEFWWEVPPSNKLQAGQSAGFIDKLGYRIIGFKGSNYKGHRLAWLIMTGEQPTVIDHIDGNKANNRFSNLRNVDWVDNCHNRVEHRSGGVLGVHWCNRAEKWVAQALQATHGEQRFLGYFRTQDEARAAVEASFLQKPRKAI